MNVSEFYARACKDKSYYKFLSSDGRNKTMKACFKQVCISLKEGSAYGVVMTAAKDFLQKEYGKLSFSYSWQKDKAVEDDCMKLSRFLKWLDGVTILETDKVVSLPFKNDLLRHTVSLIVQYENGKHGAINVSMGKSKKSFGGKNVHTNITSDLYALISKATLEKEYPGIVISNVYLSHADDRVGDILPNFVVSTTQKSNVYSLTYNEYYDSGVFNYEKFYETITEVIRTPLSKNCFGCLHKSLCNLKPLNKVSVLEDIEDTNSPATTTYTDTQLKVIDKVDGAMLVCAGPGSGKTATLVGRIHSLIKKGIEPDFILAITFSREAAGELKERLSDLPEMPYVSTIHALCYDILRKNADLVGKELNLLSNDKNFSIIEGMVDVFDPLYGFDYSNKKLLLKNVASKLDTFIRIYAMDEEHFLEDEKNLRSDFIKFATYYADLLKAKGYISFTEQISLCVKLLEEHPDVLSMYSSLYQYIMVDEFQDVDELQVKFIYMLATHGNIVVVGDDDQNIYGFRGGSHKFMIEFPNHFKGCETVVLKENFRSTKKLVSAAQALIKTNGERIKKDVFSGRTESGLAPVVVADTSPSYIDSVIQALHGKYAYKDIAILSMKNSTLETYADSLTVPVVLEKSLLREDALFLLVHDILQLWETGMKDNYSLYRVCRLFGANPCFYEDSLYNAILNSEHLKDVFTGDYQFVPKDSLTKAFSFLNCAFNQVADVSMTPAFFIQFIAYALELEDSPAVGCLLNLVDENHITTMRELSSFVFDFLRFEDETRIDVSNINAVHLITNHDSKGREFDVVIMVDDFSSNKTEENRRLFYVAMTRAKDILYVLYDGEKESLAEELLLVKEEIA